MKYTEMKALQEQVKKGSTEIIKRHGIVGDVSVELAGHINSKSDALICIRLLKPDNMCTKEEFTAENYPKSYPADMLPDFYDRILTSCVWDHDEYGYEVMPLSADAKAAFEEVKKYAQGVFDDVFSEYNLWLNAWFKTEEELNG